MSLPLLLAATGCSLTRPPAQATAPIPAQWNAALPPTLPHNGSLPALADWWRTPGDPLLVELIEAAERESPSIASAAARIVEARATRTAAGAALLPNLDGSVSASRGNAGFGSSPTGPIGSTGTGSGSSAASPSSSASSLTTPLTTLQAGLQSRWEIDLFGGLRANRDAATARLAGADAKWHDARVAVAAETANAYFAERACAQQLTVAESDAGSRAETARLTDLSAQAGFTAPADAALARPAQRTPRRASRSSARSARCSARRWWP